MSRMYKVRKFKNGASKAGAQFVNYSLTVPANVADRLPEGIQFTCEMTSEGILYRPAKQTEEAELPDWASE